MAYVTVILPNGKLIECSDGTDVWCHEGGAGYLSPLALASDPEQPRKHMDKAELAELRASVMEVGVREPLTITPIAACPWITAKPPRPTQQWWIVSGHRRNDASLEFEHQAVPVRVMIYETAADHYLDRSILNKDRASLTPLEEGYEAVQLREAGVTLEKIAKSFGCSVQSLNNKIHLTQLDDDIRALLNPSLAKRDRLPSVVGYALGAITAPSVEEIKKFLADHPEADFGRNYDGMSEMERRFIMQGLFWTVVNKQGLSTQRALTLIKNYSVTFGSTSARVKGQRARVRPDKQADILGNLLKVMEDSVVLDWSAAEWRQILATMPREDVRGLLNRVRSSRGLWDEIEKQLARKLEPEQVAA